MSDVDFTPLLPLSTPVRLLVGDGRFHAGEIGEIIGHDSEKYDYLVRLRPGGRLPDWAGGGKARREYFFYRNEVEAASRVALA